jgi:hypothetical protein
VGELLHGVRGEILLGEVLGAVLLAHPGGIGGAIG